MSYHIILNNGYYFKSVQDIKHFILFLYEIVKKRDFLNCLETELGFVIDMGFIQKIDYSNCLINLSLEFIHHLVKDNKI